MDEEIWRYSFGRSVMGLYSYGVFSNRSFNRFMRSTYASISTSMVSVPTGHGGGFSGGGSGGGGRRFLVILFVRCI